MASSRPRIVAGVVVISAIVVAGFAVARRKAAGDSAKVDYRGHQILVWAIDKKPGAVAGFARGTIHPGQADELVPVTGHTIHFEAGAIEAVSVTDLRKEWQENLISVKISHGRASSEGAKALTAPFLSLDYGIDEPVSSVVLGIPVASLQSTRYREVLGREDVGTASGLEDLLFAALDDSPPAGYVRISDVLEVYRVLGRSQRVSRWSRRLSGGAPQDRLEAAAVLMMLGDEAGTASFCRSCLQARGNDQVPLIDTLCQMPPSDEALATIVKLIVAPETSLTRTPAGGTADIEASPGK